MKNIFYLLIVMLFFSCNKDKNNTLNPILLHASTGDNPGIYDSKGRYMIMRGANYNVLGYYWQANPNIPATVPYDANDFKIMAKHGFNCVRLLINWSELEPQRGQYDYNYIAKIKSAIEEAAKYKIYTLIDMHQDAWSASLATPRDVTCTNPSKGFDGAPAWATNFSNQSTCLLVNGLRETAPAVIFSFQDFWDNTNGVQDAMIAAWQEVVKKVADNPYVLGYDLINEPNFGWKIYYTQTVDLGKFYDRAIKKIRQTENEVGGFEHIAFVEPSIEWAGLGTTFPINYPFTNDENLVFAPHLYIGSIAILPVSIEQGFKFAESVAKNYKTTFFSGEWGWFGDIDTDVPKVKEYAKWEDNYFIGGTYWQWCQTPGDPHSINYDGTEYPAVTNSLVRINADGSFNSFNEPFLKVLARTRPIAVNGKLLKLISNSANGTMQLKAIAVIKGATQIWIPNYFGTPNITGTNIKNINIKEVDGGFIADIEVQNSYEINVSF